MSERKDVVAGVVEATLPRELYRVRLESGGTVTASVGREAKRVLVKLLPGDHVTLELSPFDPTRARIQARK
jgi:translation initiation factor IF-1